MTLREVGEDPSRFSGTLLGKGACLIHTREKGVNRFSLSKGELEEVFRGKSEWGGGVGVCGGDPLFSA